MSAGFTQPSPQVPCPGGVAFLAVAFAAWRIGI